MNRRELIQQLTGWWASAFRATVSAVPPVSSRTLSSFRTKAPFAKLLWRSTQMALSLAMNKSEMGQGITAASVTLLAEGGGQTCTDPAFRRHNLALGIG